MDDLGLPALALGVAQVHADEIAGEQRRLLAALTRLDLHDHVFLVRGVTRDEQVVQPLGELLALRGELRGLLGERGVLAGELPGRLHVALDLLELPVRRDDRGELGVPAAEPAGLGLVSVHVGVCELLLKLVVLAQ